jgi:hypothetical protein
MTKGKLYNIFTEVDTNPDLKILHRFPTTVYSEKPCDAKQLIDQAKNEYLKKCKPELTCNCSECEWFKKWFGE